ncbi:DUF3540 domain-containing protein [Variovorax sp. NFACC27]|uniref:DUF3540 domain-containing protein n=1 Tax=unclassified Variovorax TaxID=663243 RepID=UPI002782B2F3|nr:hypothetical protein [Variovorax paradoxus]
MSAHTSSVVAFDRPTRAESEAVERRSGGMVNALGVVTGALPGGIYTVVCDEVPLRCQRAASCLLRPEMGDTVLVSGPDAQRLYLTAVAEQADSSMSRIETEGSMTLAANSGEVNIEADTQLALKGRQSVHIGTSRLALDAAEADCRVGRLDYEGTNVEARVLNVRIIGRLYETVVDRLVQLSRSAFRMTDGVEQVRAGRLDYQADEMLRVHAKNTFVTADRVVKVDARQIHVG